MSLQAGKLFEEGWGNYAIRGISELTLPPPVSLWPQTLGWQLLLLALMMVAVLKGGQRLRRHWRNRYRREALKELARIRHRLEGGETAARRALPVLLKAVALQAYPRTDVAGLSGGDWEHFLDRRCPRATFTKCFSGLLATLSYAPLTEQPALSEDFWSQLQHWLQNHIDTQQLYPEPVPARSLALQQDRA